MEEGNAISVPVSVLRKNSVPPEVNVFTSEVWWRMVLTMDQLEKWFDTNPFETLH